jgi:hypothetical protein
MKLAAWLEREYPSAVTSLMEGLEECFSKARDSRQSPSNPLRGRGRDPIRCGVEYPHGRQPDEAIGTLFLEPCQPIVTH